MTLNKTFIEISRNKESSFVYIVLSTLLDSKFFVILIFFTALSLKTNKVYACDICTKNNCSNGGVCVVKSVKKGYVCACKKAYTGEYCRQRIERCYPHACNLAGKCFNKPKNGYFCKCTLGRFGQFCEKGIKLFIN